MTLLFKEDALVILNVEGVRKKKAGRKNRRPILRTCSLDLSFIRRTKWKRGWGPGGMTSSSIELGGPSAHHHLPAGLTSSASLGHGRRSRTPLTDLDSKFVTKSGFCGSIDVSEGGGSFRGVSGGSKITHFASSSSGVSGVGAPSCDDCVPRFPRLDQCAHFHYEYVELPPIQVTLVTEELKPLSSAACSEDGENRSLLVQVTSLGRSWVVRRTYDNFRFLDRQLHRCCYDRKFSQLQELPPEENLSGEEKEAAIETSLRTYLQRLSDVAGSLITCGPVLGWLELDNRGHRLIVTDDSDINTPAVAAAYVIKRYAAQASDEISFEVGDMISVIDMPPPEESIWWRGKRGFQVGFFPCECVQVIGDKMPQSIHPQALSLPHTRSASNTPPTQPHQTHAFLQSRSSDGSCTVEPIKPVLRKHGKLIAFFRSFILSRPSRRKLKQSGILRERVFGCDLGEHLLNSGHEIPMVLKCCSEFIESHGTVDGIYRLSGITSNIQKLRHAFDEERIPDLYGDESILQDIHCVSSVLKMYFRELPNPLLTYQLYDKFVYAVMQNEDVRLLHVRDVVQQLPPPHYRTLEYLVQHLARIASHSSNTGMTPRNIAIVWAPNLLRSKDLEKGGVAALQDVGTQAVVTEYLVRYVDLIFNDKIPIFSPSTNGLEGTPKKSRPKSLAISTPTKLLSIDEARNRALAAIKSDQKYIEVGGGPQSLPKTYHTVIDLPSRKGGSLKQKKSPSGWKTLFSKNRHQRKASTPNEISLNVSDPAVTELDLSSHSFKRLRPVKSVESLVSTPASKHSSRNSQPVDNESRLADSCGVKSPFGLRKERPSSSSSDSISLPSPRTHNRSVSHDSYFNVLDHNSFDNSATGAVKEERESDLEFSPESSKIFLDISELNIDFNISEAEMKIFSEDDTLKSTSVEDTLSRTTIDLENVSMNSDCTKSKENVDSNSRDSKKSLKDKLKQKFSSPSSQRKESRMSNSNEDSRSSSLKRASAVIKDKFVQALSPESLRKKVDQSRHSASPCESPKYKLKRMSTPELSKISDHKTESSPNVKEDLNLSLELGLSDDMRELASREMFESALIDPELMDKITRMCVSSSVSASEASSFSLAGATVSDNESFTLGSSSSGAAAGWSGTRENFGGSDSGSTVPHSSRTTPCTPPVTIVTDPQFQEEIVMRERAYSSNYEESSKEILKNNKPRKERPNSLLGIPTTELGTSGCSLTSPDTPQGDSTFLEIQYHPLSDTTEPSTPSESHVVSEVMPGLVSSDIQRKSTALSPDLSSSSGDDPIENGPVYENVELNSTLPMIKLISNIDEMSNKDSSVSSLKQSPEAETPTAEESELEYENIEYNHLDPGDGEHYSNSVTPCYENYLSDFSLCQTQNNVLSNTAVDRSEDLPMATYANVTLKTSKLDDIHNSCDDAYEEVSFSDHPEYENVEFSQDDGKTDAEIEGEMVYQQVRYLRRSIQEVNEILNDPSVPTGIHKQSAMDISVGDSQEKETGNTFEFQPSIEENECLESPVTPSSCSLVTEVLVLPSFSSPTESTTEEATSPDASDHNSPKLLQQPYSPSPSSDSPPPTAVQSPNAVPSFLPGISPSSPDSCSSDTPEATSTPTHAMPSTFIPAPFPRLASKHSQVWPPVPKPRSLPVLNINSPSTPPTSNPSMSPNSSTTSGTISHGSGERSPSEEQEELLPFSSSQSNSLIINSETAESVFESHSSLPVISQQLVTIDQAPESESQKRERIEKYKEERRSFLREKYKSESFKGEKDEMILRLKQKATSPSRLEDNDDVICDSNVKNPSISEGMLLEENLSVRPHSSSKSFLVYDGRTTEDVQSLVSSNSQSQCSNSYTQIFNQENSSQEFEFKNKMEPMLHRSISEDSKIVPDSGSITDNSKPVSSNVSSKNKNSPIRTSSDSTFQKSYNKFRPEEDVNVRERVAIWSRQEESNSLVVGKNPNGAQIKPPETLAKKEAEELPPKLRKVQVPPLRCSDSSIHSLLAQKQTLTVSGTTSGSFLPKVHKPSMATGNKTNKLNELASPKGEFPPTSSPFTKSAPHSPIKKCPVLVSQKSESDLRAPRPLRTVRSYSVSTSLGSASKNRSSNQQTRIKDMKALFEKESPTSEFNKPFPLRQTSKGGV